MFFSSNSGDVCCGILYDNAGKSVFKAILTFFVFCKYYKVKPMAKEELPSIEDISSADIDEIATAVQDAAEIASILSVVVQSMWSALMYPKICLRLLTRTPRTHASNTVTWIWHI